MQDYESRYASIGLAMTTLVRVQIPSLVSTMLTHQQEEWNIVEKSVLKEMHVIDLVRHISQHLTQLQQKCSELHHGSPCIHCHGHNIRGEYP